jgi:stage V sporulation protein B
MAVGGFFYLVMLLFTKTLTKIDILMLSNGEKFINILEKHKLLGYIIKVVFQ